MPQTNPPATSCSPALGWRLEWNMLFFSKVVLSNLDRGKTSEERKRLTIQIFFFSLQILSNSQWVLNRCLLSRGPQKMIKTYSSPSKGLPLRSKHNKHQVPSLIQKSASTTLQAWQSHLPFKLKTLDSIVMFPIHPSRICSFSVTA